MIAHFFARVKKLELVQPSADDAKAGAKAKPVWRDLDKGNFFVIGGGGAPARASFALPFANLPFLKMSLSKPAKFTVAPRVAGKFGGILLDAMTEVTVAGTDDRTYELKRLLIKPQNEAEQDALEKALKEVLKA